MNKLSLAIALSAALFHPGVSAANLSLTGNLRFVSSTTLTIRLSNGIVIDARLPKSGELTAEKIVAQYKFADQVQAAYKSVSQSPWDDSVKRYHSLELTGLRFVRAGSPQELTQVVASLAWQPGENLLKSPPAPPKPPRAPDPEGLERVRDVNLARAEKLPSFIADEVAVRSLRRKGQAKWKMEDTVESEIAFHGDDVGRQNIRINGKRFTTISGWLPGVNWGVGFGSELHPLLDRDCANTFELTGHEELRGRKVTAYRFHTPLDGCFGAGVIAYQQYDSAQEGRILVDETDGSVLQMDYQAVGVPSELEGGTHMIYSWDYVKIGDASYLLPVAVDSVWVTADGSAWHIAVQYKNHRHFESSSSVTFHP